MKQLAKRIPKYGWILAALLLVGAAYFSVVQQSVWRNLGMISMTHGMMTKNADLMIQGQALLRQASPQEENMLRKGLAQFEIVPNNLLANGSFEFHTYGWSLMANPGATIEVDAKHARSGTKSLAVHFDGSDVNFYSALQRVPVRPATCYRLTAYIAATHLTDDVALETWDAERSYAHWYGGQTDRVKGSTDWTEVTSDFCTGDDVDEISVRLRRYGGRGQGVSGTAWFDDIYLNELTGKIQ